MKNLGDLRYMEIKHAAEKGKGSLHWYTSVALSKDLKVRNALIDTGASFSTIECRLLAMLNYQELDDFREMVRSTSSDVIMPHLAIEPNDDGAKTGETGKDRRLHGVLIRNVKVGEDDYPYIKVYTSLDYVVDNIIGMDILRCYDFRMNLDEASANLDHLIEYKPKIDGSAEIKVLQ